MSSPCFIVDDGITGGSYARKLGRIVEAVGLAGRVPREDFERGFFGLQSDPFLFSVVLFELLFNHLGEMAFVLSTGTGGGWRRTERQCRRPRRSVVRAVVTPPPRPSSPTSVEKDTEGDLVWGDATLPRREWTFRGHQVRTYSAHRHHFYSTYVCLVNFSEDAVSCLDIDLIPFHWEECRSRTDAQERD